MCLVSLCSVALRHDVNVSMFHLNPRPTSYDVPCWGDAATPATTGTNHISPADTEQTKLYYYSNRNGWVLVIVRISMNWCVDGFQWWIEWCCDKLGKWILTARTCRLNMKHRHVQTFDTSTMNPFIDRFIGNCENIGISWFEWIQSAFRLAHSLYLSFTHSHTLAHSHCVWALRAWR